MPEEANASELLPLISDIVAAHVSNNKIAVSELPQLIQNVHAALAEIGMGKAPEIKPEPAVTAKKSITPDHLVCIDCGQKMKVLKRHLRADHNLTPDEYRARWGLAREYPMVAANYAKQRSKLAKAIGLGRKPRGKRAQALVSKRSTRSKRVARK